MIFTSEKDIFERIEKPKNSELIRYAKKCKEKGELHILGIGLDKFITTVNKIEDEGYLSVKKKLSNAMTVKVFEKNLRPMTNIFTAKGGLKTFNIEDKENDTLISAKFTEKVSNNLTINEWIQQIWKPFVNIDPFGISFVEINPDTLEPELKYYSPYIRKDGVINDFYRDIDFSSSNKIEYIIFYWDKDDNDNQIYRVIDDANDYLVLQEKTKMPENAYSIINTIPNYFQVVPGCLNSTKRDVTIDNGLASYCKEAFILADDYLNDYTDFRIYKKKIGIPRLWEFKTTCEECNGTGVDKFITDKNINNSCSACGGNGYQLERNLTDILLIDILERDVQSYIPPSGVVTLPVDIQEQMITGLQNMEIDIFETIWGNGTYVSKERKDTTAFEISVRSESTVNKLKEITENKIIVEKKLIELIGKVWFGVNFKGVFISAPTQYILNTGTEAMQIYLESKKQGASNSLLDQLYEEYLNSEYENNPVKLKEQKNLFLLEPYPHLTLLECQSFANRLEFDIKKNFEKYISVVKKKTDLSSQLVDIDKVYEEISGMASINLKKVENASISESPEIREQDI